MKRTFIIVAGITVLAGAVVFYFVRQRPAAPPIVLPSFSPTATPIAKPTIPMLGGRATRIYAGNVIDPALRAEHDEILFFDQSDWKLRAASLDGKNVRELSPSVFKDVVAASWAPKGSRVILESVVPGGNTSLAIFDYAKNTSVALGAHVKTAAWSWDGQSIVFLGYEPAKNPKRYLAVMKAGGSNATTLVPWPSTNVVLFWPIQNTIYIADKATPGNVSSLFALDLKTLIPRRIAQAYGLEASFSPTGGAVLLSSTEDEAGLLLNTEVRDLTNGDSRQLPFFFLTFASKCGWSLDGTLMYCALPEQSRIEAQADVGDKPAQPYRWPFSYISEAVYTADSFVVFNKKTSEITHIETRPGVDATHILPPPDKKQLFFVNRLDHNLYSVVIEP